MARKIFSARGILFCPRLTAKLTLPPIPTSNPKALKTANIYYSASDILLSLYHGDELPVQYDIWFQKAQSLLDDYIESEIANGSDDGDVDAVDLQMVKHSHGLSYSEKRNRTGGVRGWVR